jgi:hypothetical protein
MMKKELTVDQMTQAAGGRVQTDRRPSRDNYKKSDDNFFNKACDTAFSAVLDLERCLNRLFN